MKKLIAVIGLCVVILPACANSSGGPPGDSIGDRIDSAPTGDHRDPANVARDRYRHPRETLMFFGLEPDMTVVEIWPGGGWYAEILAPVLRGSGKYYAAGYDTENPDQPAYRARTQRAFENKLKAHPEVYDEVLLSKLSLPDHSVIAPAGSADLVLTFRNTHSFMRAGQAAQMFDAFYAALKPGGSLGVVQHRAPQGTSLEVMKSSGYVTEEQVILLAKDAGFVLTGRSQINANPLDTADHPQGVWTLPPSLRLGDSDREKYLAIGESDRMTLRFIKPDPIPCLKCPNRPGQAATSLLLAQPPRLLPKQIKRQVPEALL